MIHLSPSAVSIAEQLIAECRLLATFSELPDQTTRRFLTPPVALVHNHLRQRMQALGMTTHTDALGNLRGLWQPELPASIRIALGSHIDTVPNAGAFDGVLGVVLALELVRLAKAASLPIALEILAFSEEEGVRFATPFLGSRAVAGRFDPALLSLTDSDGLSLEQAIRGFGPDLLSEPVPQAIENAKLDPQTRAFLEIHIEQGPVLEAEDLSLGVVTSIVGQTRCSLTFVGHANHAGTTPMHLRHDALAAAAEWTLAVESHAQKTDGLVATVGKIEAHPNAANVIPGYIQLSLDIRHADDAARNSSLRQLLDQAQAIAARRGIELSWQSQIDQSAIPMDEQLTDYLVQAVAAAGLPQRQLPSGAGHDAMILATRLPTAMLFLRSPGGLSHHPDEAVRPADVAAALLVAFLFLERLSVSAA